MVEDSSGNQLQLYEYRGRRLFARVRRYVLDTGETVRRLDSDTYLIAGTGERLVRCTAERCLSPNEDAG